MRLPGEREMSENGKTSLESRCQKVGTPAVPAKMAGVDSTAYLGAHPDNHSVTHPGMESCSQSCTLACTLACNLECAQPGMESGMAPVMHPDAQSGVQSDMYPGAQRLRCPKGYSAAQINLIGLLLGVGSRVSPYEQLAHQLGRFYGMNKSGAAVRGLLDRLSARGVIRRKQAREGMLQGLMFVLDMDRICPYIRPPEKYAHPGMDPGMQPAKHLGVHPGAHPAAPPGMQARSHPGPSILEETDRKNLSVSSGKAVEGRTLLEALAEEDIVLHWPGLARCGFGTAQIRQIVARREQVGEGVENVMQGLNFAEWELANQCMHDSKGNNIENPLNWVFHILATQGYYPRPANYISPAEQAERDREEIAKREQQAIQARRSAEADIWLANLTQSEKDAILKTTGGIQGAVHDQTRLRLHFQDKVWPTLREATSED